MELMELKALVDEYDRAREERLAADRVAAKLKRDETILHDNIMGELIGNDVMYAGGTYKRVKRNIIDKPKVEDWSAVHAYMREYDAMELMQKRLHEGAYTERTEDGIIIPGIVLIEVNKLSIGKI
jgi:hypothetical protein